MSDFAANRVSGSVDVATVLLTALDRWIATDRSQSAADLRARLLEWLRMAQAAQPSFALVHQLAARALAVADAGVQRGDPPSAIRAQLAQSVAAERADLAAATQAVAHTANELIAGEKESWIATLSYSSTVLAALLEAHRAGLKPRVLIGEGRPRFEGRAMATALAAAGVPTWLVIDAALPLLLQQARALWIGADAVTEHGVINKIGSFAAALAAREHSVPVYSLAARRKFIPGGTRVLAIAEMPPDEVWDTPPEGVRPRNVYFELVPMALIRGVVVEDSVLGATEVAVTARDRTLPDELAAPFEQS